MINGQTRVVAIIADPIAHVRTPEAFNALMQHRGINAVLVPFHVNASHFDAFIKHVTTIQSLHGLIVTIPYKESVLAHCHQLSDAARRIGAANIIRFDRHPTEDGCTLSAHNLDGEGFVTGLITQGHDIKGKRVYLAGAGGAGKAIAHALADHSVDAIGIYNRSPERAHQLISELNHYYPHIHIHLADDQPTDYDYAINSTSLGLSEGDAHPFAIDHLPIHATVAEVVMKTKVTPLLEKAQRRGLKVHYGHHMMDAQIMRMASFFGFIS